MPYEILIKFYQLLLFLETLTRIKHILKEF